MERLIEGVKQFRRRAFLPNQAFFEKLAAKKQNPMALFITCSDSRINPNLITQTEPGDLFLIRNAGNLVPPYGAGTSEAATIEFSIEVLGIRDIVLCGHSKCGAIQAILEQTQLAGLPAVRQWCDHAETTRRIVQRKYPGFETSAIAGRAAMANVLVQMEHLQTHPCVGERIVTGDIRIFGWYYDIGTGVVSQYDKSRGDFYPLNDEPNASQPLGAGYPGDQHVGGSVASSGP